MLHCMYCRRPMNIPRRVLAALAEGLERRDENHIDIACPRCGKINKVSRHAFLKLVGPVRPRNVAEA